MIFLGCIDENTAHGVFAKPFCLSCHGDGLTREFLYVGICSKHTGDSQRFGKKKIMSQQQNILPYTILAEWL
jgi:hypothetical protein